MTRAASATARAFLSSIGGLDYDDELAVERLAEEWHSVACSKMRKWPEDHEENELVLFHIVVARLKESG